MSGTASAQSARALAASHALVETAEVAAAPPGAAHPCWFVSVRSHGCCCHHVLSFGVKCCNLLSTVVICCHLLPCSWAGLTCACPSCTPCPGLSVWLPARSPGHDWTLARPTGAAKTVTQDALPGVRTWGFASRSQTADFGMVGRQQSLQQQQGLAALSCKVLNCHTKMLLLSHCQRKGTCTQGTQPVKHCGCLLPLSPPPPPLLLCLAAPVLQPHLQAARQCEVPQHEPGIRSRACRRHHDRRAERSERAGEQATPFDNRVAHASQHEPVPCGPAPRQLAHGS